MREGERVREGERGEGGKERERERESSETYTHVYTCKCIHTHIQQADIPCTHILCPYYYALYTHPERDQCYNESRQSVPDASSGPGQ